MTMTFIQSQLVSSAIGSVTFSNIPQDFTHLELRCFSRGNFNPGNNTAGTVYVRFNGDSTGANYQNHYMRGDGYNISSSSNLNTGVITFTSTVPLFQGTSNVFGINICEILDYTSTVKNKVTRNIGGFDQNVSSTNAQFVTVQSGLWLNTSPITSITILTDGNHVAGSRFDLYGISSSKATGA